MPQLEHFRMSNPFFWNNLVKLRASQMNACAYCIDMHWKDARAAGESEQRLYGLAAWREAPYYSDRERAAFEWTESITNIAAGHALDAVYEQVRAHFSAEHLTIVLSIIRHPVRHRRPD